MIQVWLRQNDYAPKFDPTAVRTDVHWIMTEPFTPLKCFRPHSHQPFSYPHTSFMFAWTFTHREFNYAVLDIKLTLLVWDEEIWYAISASEIYIGWHFRTEHYAVAVIDPLLQTVMLLFNSQCNLERNMSQHYFAVSSVFNAIDIIEPRGIGISYLDYDYRFWIVFDAPRLFLHCTYLFMLYVWSCLRSKLFVIVVVIFIGIVIGIVIAAELTTAPIETKIKYLKISWVNHLPKLTVFCSLEFRLSLLPLFDGCISWPAY